MNDKGILLHVSGADAAGVQAGIRAAQNAGACLPNVRIDLVVQGPCVAFLRAGSVLEAELAALPEQAGQGRHVHVLACGNGMRSAGMEADDLCRDVSMVPAAVAHLAVRQFDGWAYVRV